jgi:Sulfotransferase family
MGVSIPYLSKNFYMYQAPLFILASPRSYTSLICAMLGQHPEAYGFPELNLFVRPTIRELLKDFQRDAQFQVHGVLRTIAQLYTGEQTIYSINMAYRWLMRRIENTTAEIYVELCQKIWPLRGIDKSPAYLVKSIYLDRILQTFPHAYFLHLVRHPFAQGKSAMQTGGGQFAKLLKCYDYTCNPPIIDPQFAWFSRQKMIIEFLKKVPEKQKLFLRGEDVLSEPEFYFEKVCNWLGISWNESVLAAITHPQDSPYACLGPYGTTLGNDANFLRSPVYKRRPIPPSSLDELLPWRPDGKGFLPEVIRLAHELGYD